MTTNDGSTTDEQKDGTARRPNPWVSMWMHPRLTLQNLIDTGTEFDGFFSVVIIAGIAQKLSDTFFDTNVPSDTILKLLGFAVVGGIISSLIYLLLASYLIHLIGQYLGGKASRDNIIAAVGWSEMPLACSMLIWILYIPLFASGVIGGEVQDQSISSASFAITTIILLIQVTLTLWSVVILLSAIGQVQRFSIGMTLLNTLPAFALLSAPYAVYYYFLSR